MIQYLYTLQNSLYENKYIPSGSLQSMRSLCEVSFGEWANYFLIVQWICLHRGRLFLVNNLIHYSRKDSLSEYRGFNQPTIQV